MAKSFFRPAMTVQSMKANGGFFAGFGTSSRTNLSFTRT